VLARRGRTIKDEPSMKPALAGAAAIALLLSAPALAAGLDAPAVQSQIPALQVVVTKHTGVFNGQKVAYTATVAEYLVAGADGKPGAEIVTIAYARDVKSPVQRPVMFVYNGGPGASSSPLHMNGLGPMRKVAADAPKDGPAFRDNPFSPLDAFDLVFIDPVGTGYSRPLGDADTKAWYSRSGDAQAVGSVIKQWLKANQREASPRYMTGESYGTTRAAMILKVVPDLKFDGVALVALVADTSGREMPYVAALPTMAAGAWYHQRVDRKGPGLRAGRLRQRPYPGFEPAGC
jgi:carboxypeptidase C (cathepsin A)